MGLGNPGPEYAATRHNAGWLLLDHLAQRWGFGPFRRDGQARRAEGTRRGTTIILVKPLTYMNRSGAALAPFKALAAFDARRDLMIVVDEVALPVGTFRIRPSGSAGGHNGLKSIEGALRSQEYPRLRIGVGPRPEGWDDLADYVLEPFAAEERETINALLPTMADAVACWLDEGIDHTMNRFNR